MGVLALLVAAAVLTGCAETDPSADNRVDGGVVTPNNTSVNVQTSERRFRVGTFNTRRFFDTICDSSRCENNDFEDQLSDAELAFKADQIAGGILEMNADAVMLQEVESEEALVALYERLADDYNIAIIGETGGTGSLDTAIVARGEFIGTVSHYDTQLTRPDGSSTGFARDFLELVIRFDGTPVHLFSAHFKSKRNDDPGRRFAEAEAARDIAWTTSQANPEALVLVAGDMNDTPDSDPIEAMTAGGFLNIVPGADGEWWTYNYGPTQEALDHIMLVRNERFRADGLLDFYRDGSGGFASSDHSAVAVDIVLPQN
jgi:predicted extracellular nuclease